MESSSLEKLRINDRERFTVGNRSPIVRVLKWALLILLLAAAAAGILWKTGILFPPVEVQVIKVSRTRPSEALTEVNASGYVVAQRKAAVSSKATGRLARLNIEEGQAVKEDEIIAALENEDLKAALDEAEAALKVAEARVRTAEAEEEDATVNYRRLTALEASEAVSKQELDAVTARYKKALAAKRSAVFGVTRARAAVELARVNLEYSHIRAPFDGVILTKNAEEGEVVAPFGGSLNAKAAVATMADMDSLMVEVDVAESNLGKVHVGQACEIRLDALPGERFPGVVHAIVPTADRSKATVMTKVRFENLDKRVLPEMSAKVAFLSRPLKADEQVSVLTIPKAALKSRKNPATVVRIDSNRAHVQPVVLGRRWDSVFEVEQGLSPGDRVVINPTGRLETGVRVSVPES